VIVSVSNGAIGQAGSISIPRPREARSGDLLIASCYVEATGARGPAGATEVVPPVDDTEGDWQYVWSWPDDGASSWTIAGWTGSVYVDWQLLVVRGADPARPINAAAGQVNIATRSMTAPSITTTVDSCLLLMLGTTNGPATATPPAGMVELSDDAPCWAGSEPQASAGPTGTRTATLSQAWTNTAVLLALAPSAAPVQVMTAGGLVDHTLHVMTANGLVDLADLTIGD